MIRRALCIAVLMLSVAASHAPAGSGLIRLSDRNDLFGWEAVGRIDIGGQGYCTGVLIASDLVLTAAHCVYDHQNRAVAASDLTFRSGLRDGEAIAERRVARIVAHNGYDPHRGYGVENARHDAALLELEQPISTALAAPFFLHSGTDKGLRVSVVSYGRGRDDALSWQRDSGVLGRRLPRRLSVG